MTITIQRGKSDYVYRINEYCLHELLYRRNKHNARWVVYDRYRTPEEATAALLKLDGAAPVPHQRNESKDHE